MTDRLWDAFRQLVGLVEVRTKFYATYEYTIQATDGLTVDVTPNDTTQGLPAMNKVQLRADTLASQTPKTGNLAHVIFANGDAAKPVCVWCQPNATKASVLGGSQAIARQGDSCSSNLPVGYTFVAGVLGLVAPPGGGPVTGVGNFTITAPPVLPIPGIVISGSPKVTTA